MEYLAGSFVLAAVIVGVWTYFSRSGRVFTIQFRNGVAKVRHGKVSPNFVLDLAEVLTVNGIVAGRVFGIRRLGRVSLGFSSSIPTKVQQSIRNVWAIHR